MAMTGPDTGVVGVPINYQVTVTNPGDGPASNVMLSAQYDPGLEALQNAKTLTLALGPKQPEGIPEPNWLPTPEGKKYNVTFRFYGPTKDVTDGKYFPPPLVRTSATRASSVLLSVSRYVTAML